jgi:3-oxoacyl-[acyl-carrier protein] reductase
MRHEVSYAGSQAGLEGMVRALAVDEAENGMTVNAVAPG